MAESHAYGTSLGCISRRIFILWFCVVMSAWCWVRIAKWLFSLDLVNSLMGVDWLPTKACVGMECYDVFTCRGMAWTTNHFREPLATMVGALVFPLGISAAMHGYRDKLKLVAAWLSLLLVLDIVCFVGDITYFETCDAYPGNIIDLALLWPISFPIRPGMQDELRKMRFFPKFDVDKVTGGFGTLWFYLAMQVVVILILAYTAGEARKLGMLLERGPLGLGVHYGLGQFDEVLNHEAMKKRKEPRSVFVEDGLMPSWEPSGVETPLGYYVGHDYGAHVDRVATLSAAPSKDEEAAPSKDMENFMERNAQAERNLEEARDAFHEAEKNLEHAKAKLAKENDEEIKMEKQAADKFRQAEEKKEMEEEKDAEDFAQDEADKAREKAEKAGKSPREIQAASIKAFEKEMSKRHKAMIEKAQLRATHEHYRHSEREKKYHKMAEEVAQKVQGEMAELDQARQRLQRAEEAKRSLDEEEARIALAQIGVRHEHKAEDSKTEGGGEHSKSQKAVPSASPPDVEQHAAPVVKYPLHAPVPASSFPFHASPASVRNTGPSMTMHSAPGPPHPAVNGLTPTTPTVGSGSVKMIV